MPWDVPHGLLGTNRRVRERVATIRIYKVAEVLGIPSQDVIELLRKQHGIEVKSASGTIEEIVARQFAERVARERSLDLPSGQLFSQKTAARRGGKRAAAKQEPAKPAKPKLGPPRLVKAAKAAVAEAVAVADTEATEPAEAPGDLAPAVAPDPPAIVAREPIHVPTPRLMVEEAPPVAEARAAAAPETAPDEPAAPAASIPEAELAGSIAAAPPPGHEPATGSPTPTPSRATLTPRPTGRVVPPKLRLRVEEPKRVAKPAPAASPVARSGPAIRPAASGQPQLGGPRPLPSQPMRPPSARPLPPRPAVGYRPPPRPHHRPGGRKSQYRRARTQTPVAPAPPPPVTRTITLAEGMTVKDLADRLEVKPKDVLKKLIERRLMMTINTTLDSETATMIAREFGADVKMRTFEEEIVVLEAEETKPEDLVTRAPVVTVMGHVDHGKTTLLDAIRETKVAEGEAGGITQHIGAYAVSIKGRRIVFLDTPGHEAFTLMRARGAKVTDVVVLVVAADDGVMPQTQEAIDHARAANVQIIVAINKIDKADANPDRVKQELAERDLTPEDWGGSTVTVPISAKKRENLDGLLEMILLVTEMGEHKANPKRAAAGTVLEAKVDRGRGPVATILVQDGTLRVGDNFIAGVVVGRVRALIDDRLDQVREVGPSSPVEVLGLTGLPQPGDAFQAVDDAAKARQIALLRQNQAKEKALGGRGRRLTLESLQQQLAEGEAKELPINHQSRRSGIGRGPRRLARQAGRRAREDPRHPHRCRRHQRVGRAARLDLQCYRHRVQRASRPKRGRRR